MRMKKTLSLLFCFVGECIFFAAFVFAQQTAEIININYKYKIAFADLTDKDVKSGDIVNVTTSKGGQAYLKVAEAYPVMVKLVIADEPAYKLTDEQFGNIVVGGSVAVGNAIPRKAIQAVVAGKASLKVPAVSEEDTAHVESYTPSSNREIRPVERKVKTTHVPAAVKEVEDVPAVPAANAAVVEADHCKSRLLMIEERLDQVMNNNVSLSENVTFLLADKNAAEAKARVKATEAAVSAQRMEEALQARSALEAQLKVSQADLAAVRAQKTDADKEIQSLNVKLVELKKKLDRMVAIINNNMKAYE